MNPISNDAPRGWRTVLAIGWLAGFFILSYCLTPPNNPSYHRYQLWPQVPFLLMDAVDPPELSGGPPSGWGYFPQRFDLLLTAAVILAGAWGAGHLLMRLIRPPLERRPESNGRGEQALFALALGLAAMSLLTLLCGLAGWLSRGLFVAVLCGSILAELVLRFQQRKRQAAHSARSSRWKISQEFSAPTVAKGVLLAVMVPFLLAMLLGSLLPSADFDVREYHLQGPKEFYQAGRISFLPHNVYTSFPFFTEMMSLLAMTLRGDWFRGALAGKGVLMCFGPLTGWALYLAGRRWCGQWAGWLAALVYITMPWTFRISTIAYAEGGLTFYLFVSLLALGIAVETPRGEPAAQSRWFLLCGLLAGCAMACKYTGVVSVVIPLFAAACAAPFVWGRSATGHESESPQRLALRGASWFLVGTSVTIGPWLLKNLVETGNPVYPLMYTVFGGRDWNAELNQKWRAAHSPPNYSGLPQRILEVTAANDWLTPLLFGLAPLSLLLFGRRRIVGWLWLYVLWLFATWWLLTHRIDRFWVPMTPVIALLAGMGAVAVRNRAWRIALGGGIAAATLFNLTMVVSGASGNNAFLVDLRHAQNIPPGIAFLNAELPSTARVLMVGEAQVFDAEFPIVYNTVFDHSIFEQWTAADRPGVPHADLPLRDAGEIRRTLHEQGITHLFVNWREILRYRTTYGYTKFVTPDRFAALVERGVLAPPITLAVVRDSQLWEQVAAGQKPPPSDRYDSPGGGQMVIYNVRREFTPQQCRNVKTWGASLLRQERAQPLFVTGQVYRVLP